MPGNVHCCEGVPLGRDVPGPMGHCLGANTRKQVARGELSPEVEVTGDIAQTKPHTGESW